MVGKLHALTRTGGLTLDVVGGTIDQAKSDAAAANAFMEVATDKGERGSATLRLRGKVHHDRGEHGRAGRRGP